MFEKNEKEAEDFIKTLKEAAFFMGLRLDKSLARLAERNDSAAQSVKSSYEKVTMTLDNFVEMYEDHQSARREYLSGERTEEVKPLKEFISAVAKKESGEYSRENIRKMIWYMDAALSGDEFGKKLSANIANFYREAGLSITPSQIDPLRREVEELKKYLYPGAVISRGTVAS